MGKFRKKPVEIEARQLLPYKGPNTNNAQELAEWCGGRSVWGPHVNGEPQPRVLIETLEGTMAADPGWWIIKGVKGEFYPCEPEIFEMTYEKVE